MVAGSNPVTPTKCQRVYQNTIFDTPSYCMNTKTAMRCKRLTGNSGSVEVQKIFRGGAGKNPFIEIPFPDDWHWIFFPSCSVSVKAVYSSFAI